VAQLSDESRAYILVPRALDAQRAKPDEYSKAWERHQDGMCSIKRHCIRSCGIVKWCTKGFDGEESQYGY